MTNRCWEELLRAGKSIAEDPHDLRGITRAVIPYFEIPKSPEAEAVLVFLDGLEGALEREKMLASVPPLDEAAQ